MLIGLSFVLVLVLVLPLFFRRVEEQLELFLFVMGLIAVLVSGRWSAHLAHEAFIDPLPISASVLVFGLLFKRATSTIDRNVIRIKNKLGLRLFVFFLVTTLGLISSVVTAILAALILSEVIDRLRLNRKTEVRIVVLACFSIGFGAVLTPIGEPLSTIVISKLRGDPFHAGFFFLFRHLGPFVFPALLFLGIIAGLSVKSDLETSPGLRERSHETVFSIMIRALKVYIFVFGLILLGAAFKPVVDRFISDVPFSVLYWINILSAVLDNATMAAAEIGPSMSLIQIKAAILAMIVSGGMMIPGNIPNIITAGKLGIRTREWVRLGIPFGIGLLVIFFLILTVIH